LPEFQKARQKEEQEGLTGRRNGTAMASVDLKVVLLGMHPAEGRGKHKK
jgi:hypothetical protein